jgi:hypothetical protein
MLKVTVVTEMNPLKDRVCTPQSTPQVIAARTGAQGRMVRPRTAYHRPQS